MINQTGRPAKPALFADAIPAEIKCLPQWVDWRYGWEEKKRKWDKPPRKTDGSLAKVNDPRTWTSFAKALEAAQRPDFDGLGFVLTADDPYVGLDLDHCIQNGALLPWAAEIVTTIDSYTEVSPSGTGLRILVLGKLPDGLRRQGGVEMYDADRYLTFTGNHWPGTPNTIKRCPDELADVHQRHIVDVARRAGKRNGKPPAPVTVEPVDLDDDEILRLARDASNGTRFSALWDNADLSTFDSHSEADLWVCGRLAFWTRRDASRIDSLFRKSKLMRDKWDERRGQSTYGADTVGRSVAECDTVYTGRSNGTTKSTTAAGSHVSTDQTDSPIVKSHLEPHDVGNAAFFSARARGRFLYDGTRKHWRHYEGSRWRIDETGQTTRFAKAVTNIMGKLAFDIEDEEKQKAALKHVCKTKMRQRLEAMVALSQCELPATTEDFDANNDPLNLDNGTVDLALSSLHDHNPEDRITKLAPVSYDPHAEAPLWHKFLSEIFVTEELQDDGTMKRKTDKELIAWIQRFIGYCSTGHVREHAMAIFYGNGENGKSSFVNTISRIMGDYAVATPAETFLELRQHDAGAASPHLARLCGARLVTASELPNGAKLNEALIKSLTGGDPIVARGMYEHPFQFDPKFKVIISTNHKPIVHGTDDGIWSRLHFVPFLAKFPRGSGSCDATLADKLWTEAPGILNWIIAGAQDWYNNGLGRVDTVKKATQAERESQNIFARFESERCTIDTENESDCARIRESELYRYYTLWSQASGEKPLSAQRFHAEMRRRHPSRISAGHPMYLHVTVNPA